MLTETRWVITLGGVVILDEDDLIEDEVTGPTRTAVFQPVLRIGASFSDQQARGQVSHTISFTRVKKFTGSDGPRIFQFSHTMALPAGVVDCTIRALTGGEWLLARAALTAYSPTTTDIRFKAGYTITGGQLSETTAPPLVVTDDDGTGIIDDDGTRLIP